MSIEMCRLESKLRYWFSGKLSETSKFRIEFDPYGTRLPVWYSLNGKNVNKCAGWTTIGANQISQIHFRGEIINVILNLLVVAPTRDVMCGVTIIPMRIFAIDKTEAIKCLWIGEHHLGKHANTRTHTSIYKERGEKFATFKEFNC